MNSKLWSAAVVIGTFGAMATAAPPPASDPGRAAAEQALHNAYGNTAKIRIYEERNVNGVRVFTAAVDDRNGEANATVTGNGDLLDVGRAEPAAALPPAVAELVQQLFQSPPQMVNMISSRRYYARFNIGNRPYTVDMDTTGKILDIEWVGEEEAGAANAKPTRQKKNALNEAIRDARLNLAGNSAEQKSVERKTPAKERRAANPNEEQQVRERFAKTFNQDQLQSIEPDPDTPGYYFIRSRNRVGEGFAIMNAAGDVPQYRVGVPRNELPQTVQSALATLFHADKFTSFQRGEDRIYRVNEMAGPQRVDMWIRSDGEVITVNEPIMPGAQAIPAAGHTGPRR